MNQEQQTEGLRQVFNAASSDYDNPALRFFISSAKAMMDCYSFNGSEKVIDLACGTGHQTVEIARNIPNGKLHCVDISTGMLKEAEQKINALGYSHATYHEMDMLKLSFPDAYFDIAICAYGVFFVQDMVALCDGFRSKIKPGGTLLISTFTDASFNPLAETLFADLEKIGIPIPPAIAKQVASQPDCEKLITDAGFNQVTSSTAQVGYYLDTVEDWWNLVMGAAFRGFIYMIPEEQREAFKKSHLANIEKLRTEKGIWLEVEAIFTKGVA